MVISDPCKIRMKKFEKKITLKVGILALVGIAVLLIVLLCLVGYVAPEGNRFGEITRATLPLPLVVDGFRSVITTKDVIENVQSVRRFYETQDFSRYGLRIDFSTTDGKKRLLVREKEVLNKMFEDLVIIKLAHDQGINITKEAAHDGVRRKLEEYGGTAENVEANLNRLYGWTMQDFEEKVVLPDLYEEKLIAVYDKEDAHASQAEQRIREARQALDSGMSFDQVVLQYSDGRTKEIGGDLGWFLLKNLSKNLQPSVAKQKVGIVGDVIESEIGFHIILVEGTKQEGEQTFYRLKQVFVKKKTAADWLTERMRASPPIILSREYVWDAETARIEFQKSDMKQFEQELFEENQKNTSFIP